MSGVIKAVGKVFKKVIKVAKVVVPIVLAVAAVVLTVGAAIPALAGTVLGGGLASGVTGALATVGINSPFLIGAITYAGYGAAAGGVYAAATGKKITKYMGYGALAGAVVGGGAVLAGIQLPGLAAAAPGLGSAAPASLAGPGLASGVANTAPINAVSLGEGFAATGVPITTAGGGATAGGLTIPQAMLISGFAGGAANALSGDDGTKQLEARGDNYNFAGATGLMGNRTPAGVGTTSDVAQQQAREQSNSVAMATPTERLSNGNNEEGTYITDPDTGQVIKIPKQTRLA